MKRSFIFEKLLSEGKIIFLVILGFSNFSWAQTDTPLSEYNCIASPKETTIKFFLKEGRDELVRIRIIQAQILELSKKIDVVIESGEVHCDLKLALESPRLIQVEFDSLIDHIFLVPGVDTEIVLLSGPDRKHINYNDAYSKIEAYYEAKFNLLGVLRSEIEAFQFINTYPDLGGAVGILDSIANSQVDLLMKFDPLLPKWFVTHEMKNIAYTGHVFKLSNAYHLLYENLISPSDSTIVAVLEDIDSQDESALGSPFYLSSLSMAALIKYCDMGCFTHEESGLLHRHRALLQFLEELPNTEIRNALASQMLTKIYHGSRTLPPAMVQSFENYVTDSLYSARISKRKYPDLDGKDAPNFYLKDTQAVLHALRDFQGKVVLLNFWFVGCKPCKEEIPFEKDLVTSLANEPFQLVNICLTSKEKIWKDYLIREVMPGINLYANENWTQKLSREYGIRGYPQYVLVDKEGRVVSGQCTRPSSSQLIPLIQKYLED